MVHSQENKALDFQINLAHCIFSDNYLGLPFLDNNFIGSVDDHCEMICCHLKLCSGLVAVIAVVTQQGSTKHHHAPTFCLWLISNIHIIVWWLCFGEQVGSGAPHRSNWSYQATNASWLLFWHGFCQHWCLEPAFSPPPKFLFRNPTSIPMRSPARKNWKQRTGTNSLHMRCLAVLLIPILTRQTINFLSLRFCSRGCLTIVLALTLTQFLSNASRCHFSFVSWNPLHWWIWSPTMSCQRKHDI